MGVALDALHQALGCVAASAVAFAVAFPGHAQQTSAQCVGSERRVLAADAAVDRHLELQHSSGLHDSLIALLIAGEGEDESHEDEIAAAVAGDGGAAVVADGGAVDADVVLADFELVAEKVSKGLNC